MKGCFIFNMSCVFSTPLLGLSVCVLCAQANQCIRLNDERASKASCFFLGSVLEVVPLSWDVVGMGLCMGEAVDIDETLYYLV
jgi:hypothetical protein